MLDRYSYIVNQTHYILSQDVDSLNHESLEKPVGASFEGDESRIEISQASFDKILDTTERIVIRIIEWSVEAPVLFVSLCIVLLLALFLILKHRVEMAKNKAQYKNQRIRARGTTQLRLHLEQDDDGGNSNLGGTDDHE